MTTLGHNLKWTVGRSQRQAMRAMFKVFGVEATELSEHFEIFTLADGANIGIHFVEDQNALDEQQLTRAAWVELVVADEAAVTAALAEQGITPFDYSDKQHRYFRAPGGQIFRLASRP